jgi:bacteriocin-like protein
MEQTMGTDKIKKDAAVSGELTEEQLNSVSGGDTKTTTKTTNTGKAAGNVSAGWDVKQNVHI